MKKHTLRIIIICAVIVTVLIVCAAVMLFTMSGKHSKVDGIKVTDSGCDVFGISAEIVSAILDDEDPLLEIKWTNRTPKEYYISTHHTVYIESNGTFEKTEISEPSYSGKWALHPFKTCADEYSLKYAELRTGAKYRIEVKLSDKDGKKEGKAWIEFEISGKVSSDYAGNEYVKIEGTGYNENGDTFFTHYGNLEIGTIYDLNGYMEFSVLETAVLESMNYEDAYGETGDTEVYYPDDGHIFIGAKLLVKNLDEAHQVTTSASIVYNEKRYYEHSTVRDYMRYSIVEPQEEREFWIIVSVPSEVKNEDGIGISMYFSSSNYSFTLPVKFETEEIALPLELTKDSIPNTKDWKTQGLESAGLYGVEISEPYSASFGDLYILKHYNVSGVYYDTFFAIETKDTVYLQKNDELSVIESLTICDLDGENGDEICIQELTGNAVKSTAVFSVNKGRLTKIFSTFGVGERGFDTGFSFELRAPYRVVIKNEHTGYETEYAFGTDDEEYEQVYDKSGNPLENKSVWLWHTTVFPSDTDGDGVYELVANQSTCLISNADNFGECVSILKYDKKAKEFRVVDAEFALLEIPESIPNSDNWKSFLFKETVFNKEDTEISEPYSASFGNLYVISRKTEKTPLWEIYFAVENGSDIMLNQVTRGELADIKICNVDGKAGDEIIFVAFNGGCGGAGGYDTYVFNVDKGSLNRIFYASRATSRESGFESKLIAPFSIEITNKYTGYRYVESLEEGHWIRNYFDANGDPTFEGGAELDNISQIITDDVDGEGDYELICKQYTYFGSTAGFIGYSISTWNYDEALGEFIVIDAEYDPETNIDVEVLPH